MNAHAIAFSVLIVLSGTVSAETRPVSSETDAISHLMALNEHEIKAAEIAAGKGVSGPVAEYAAMLKKEHSENQSRSAQLPTAPKADAVDTSAVAAQKEKAAAERRTLSSRSGEEFERAYVAAMVKGHAEALTMIDQELLPAATTPSVKGHLQETRVHIATHLEKAESLQAR